MKVIILLVKGHCWYTLILLVFDDVVFYVEIHDRMCLWWHLDWQEYLKYSMMGNRIDKFLMLFAFDGFEGYIIMSYD